MFILQMNGAKPTTGAAKDTANGAKKAVKRMVTRGMNMKRQQEKDLAKECLGPDGYDFLNETDIGMFIQRNASII